MDAFLPLLLKLVPLYSVIFLGFIAGKYLNAKKETLASLLIYIIAPIIIFNGVVTTKITISALSLPILFFVLACVTSLIFYHLGDIFGKIPPKISLGLLPVPETLGILGFRWHMRFLAKT